MQRISRHLAEQDGATAVEYAIMAALIGAVVAATVLILGDRVHALFQSIPPF